MPSGDPTSGDSAQAHEHLHLHLHLHLPRSQRALWPEIAHLFDAFCAGHRPGAPLALSQLAGDATGCADDHVMFAPGLLRGPGFTRAATWVSGTVAASRRGGRVAPGWIEQALAAAARPGPDQRAQAMALWRRMQEAAVGGGFWHGAIAEGPERVVLRASRPAGLAVMLVQALAHHPARELLLLSDTLSARGARRLQRLGIEVGSARVDPWSVLRRARVLHVGGDDELALLGLLAGTPVHCHTPGIASGWGLTRDAAGIIQRERRDLEEVAAAVLLRGVRYGDPRTRQAIDAEAAIELLSEWRRVVQQNRVVGSCVGVSLWKRRRIAAFLHDGCAAPRFRRGAASARRAAGGRAVVGWNSRLPAGLEDALRARGQALLRVEDGFIRSLGLGSGFLPPASIIVDTRGIYYDPRQPSDLEHILAGSRFPPALIERAARLITVLNQRGITKYAAGGAATTLVAPAGRRCILVPGQVADDLSVKLGGGAVGGNLALLEAVRAAHPAAWVVYKPHPDVLAGHRAGQVAAAALRRCADQVVTGAMSALIAQVDEVHTMTSLAGFEALLRGRAVSVYGQPFYAGWGLTTDLAPLARRTRRLTLEELTAGVLILYPRYLDPASLLPCGPELLIERLGQPELWHPSRLMRLRQLQGNIKQKLQTR